MRLVNVGLIQTPAQFNTNSTAVGVDINITLHHPTERGTIRDHASMTSAHKGEWGVPQMLTFADRWGWGVCEMLTNAKREGREEEDRTQAPIEDPILGID